MSFENRKFSPQLSIQYTTASDYNILKKLMSEYEIINDTSKTEKHQRKGTLKYGLMKTASGAKIAPLCRKSAFPPNP